MKKYILNKETQKIELHFLKEEYLSLTDEQKKLLKSSYLFSGKSKAWVSRSKNNHYSAIKTAEKLGFEDGGSSGKRLSFEEELERNAERAEARAERYEQYAENADKRRESLQSEFNSMRGDWSFITQPNINSSGGRSFTNYRERIINRYEKGFEEYRKSEYFKEKAATSQSTADKSQLNSRSYLSNRIKECNKNIKAYQGHVVKYEEYIERINKGETLKGRSNDEPLTVEHVEEWIMDRLEKMEYDLDKLAYMENCLDKLGVSHSKESINPGYMVKIRGYWDLVVKANPKTVEIKTQHGMVLKYSYAEIQEVKIPDDYKEIEKKIQTIENPYKVGDILKVTNISGNRILYAFQVLKTTPKGISIQEIKLDDEGKPRKDNFVTGSKPQRKKIVKSKYSDYVGAYHNDWQMYKYKEEQAS